MTQKITSDNINNISRNENEKNANISNKLFKRSNNDTKE